MRSTTSRKSRDQTSRPTAIVQVARSGNPHKTYQHSRSIRIRKKPLEQCAEDSILSEATTQVQCNLHISQPLPNADSHVATSYRSLISSSTLILSRSRDFSSIMGTQREMTHPKKLQESCEPCAPSELVPEPTPAAQKLPVPGSRARDVANGERGSRERTQPD